jgi:hypothetical protein
MRNVYDARLQTVELKKKIKDEDKWLVSNEKQLIDAELERQNKLAEEKAAREALVRKNYQGDILKQVNERDRDLRRTIQEKMYEERAAKLAEI